jgi:hypothetical protein
MLLARPYPVPRIAEAQSAIQAAVLDDLRGMHTLFAAARDALAALDPDEVADFRREHPRVAHTDVAAAAAALDVAETWEGVVSLASEITDLRRFRGFVCLAAHRRYGERPRAEHFARYAGGAPLPHTSVDDTALLALLPALEGLGPELPDELPDPCPLPGVPFWRLLGLPDDGDYVGIDPLDATVLSADDLRAHYAGLPPGWRELSARCMGTGMIVRAG